MVRRGLVLALFQAAVATGALAKGWDPIEWNAAIQALNASELFPSDAHTGSDQGMSVEGVAASGRRLNKVCKLGLEARASGVTYARYRQASYGTLGGEASLRRGGTQVVLEGEWTPRRVKFPSEPEDAVFHRLEARIGLRQGLPGGFRLRAEYRSGLDDYRSAFDERDASPRDAFGQIAWRATPALTVRYQFQFERSDAVAARYDQDEGAAAGSASWRGDAWRLDGAITSGVRRYPHAASADANFRRRDQWLATEIRVGRCLRKGLAATLGGSLVDQTSSRIDREYHARSLRLGLEWSTPAP